MRGSSKLANLPMLALYNTLTRLAQPLASGWALWHGRSPTRAHECAQRMARDLPQTLPGSIWIHGASVGEARLVGALATRLATRDPRRPLAVSAVTPSGFAQLPSAPPVAARFYLPFDFRGYPTRVIASLDPACLVLVETELWPNLIHEASDHGLPLVLVNARLSPQRIARYRRFAALYRPVLRRLDIVCAQSDADAQRFAELGVQRSKIHVTGNIKYDLVAPHVDHEALRGRLGVSAKRPVWVAGSTRPGEERAVLAAYESLKKSFPELLLVLAPRHPERVPEIASLIQRGGWVTRHWSTLSATTTHPEIDIVLVDTLGDLAGLYGIATVAFVGGSLEPFGGHSPLEPATAGTPVLFGPHMQHFEESAAELVRRGGAREVLDELELSAVAAVWLAAPELRSQAGSAARSVIEDNRGALSRTLEAIETHIAARATP